MADVPQPTTAKYSYVFPFEEQFPATQVHAWVAKYWSFTFYVVILYIIFVFWGPRFMKRRPRFELRGPLLAWNIVLALLSVVGTFRTLPELLFLYQTFDLTRTVCDEGYVLHSPVCCLWTFVFIVLKVVELGDTMFIVLRKQSLSFLHWFHHATALLSVWYSFGMAFGAGRWVVVMNYAVHSVMYSYYALRAGRVKAPKFVSMSVTVMQMVQFVCGFSAATRVIVVLLQGRECHATLWNALVCTSVYLSNLWLFLRFFKETYLRPNEQKKK